MIDSVKRVLGIETIPMVDNYLGIVRYAFPWLNLYVVEPVLNGAISKELRLVSGEDSTTQGGSITHAYNIGDSVLVAQDSDNVYSNSVTDYIIGPASVSNADPEDGSSNTMVSDTSFLQLLDKVFNKVRVICGDLHTRARKRFTHPTDLLCGDTNIGSSPNNNISVLKHLIRIQCGKGCFVEMDSILSRLRIVTERMEYIGPLKYSQDLSGKGSLLEYSETAISYEEGLIPAYRRRDMAGDITTGWETVVAIPDLTNNKSDDVFSSKVRYDGLTSISTAKGFEIKKTLDIIAPYQKSTAESSNAVPKEVGEFPELGNNYSKEHSRDLMDDSLHLATESINKLNTEFPRVTANPDTWGTTDKNHSDVITDNVLADVREPKMRDVGSDQYYDLPGTVELKDPHTGKTYTYFKSNSGIKYEPDGSVVLYDGYGSEIRMTRGNIIISPSADLIFRPGRDIHSMAGRHTAIVSQGHAIVHSSNKNVYIKGQKDVNILAGVDNNGRILLDDRGSVGTLIRSASNSSLVAKDVFVGSIPEKSDNNYSGVTKGPGTVTIGGGVRTLITGDNVTVYGESADIIGKKDKDVSWLSIDYNRIHSISETINLSGEVTIGHASGTLQTYIGNMPIGAGNQTSSPHLHVIANMDVSYGLNCRQVWAEQVLATRVAAGNASRTSGIKQHVPVPTIGQVSPIVTQIPSQRYSYSGPWSDTYTIKSGFMYPSSGELGISGTSYVIPGMLWQKYIKDAKVWKEDSIPVYGDAKESMVYPGIEAWSGSITTGSGTVNLIGGYKINGYAGQRHN